MKVLWVINRPINPMKKMLGQDSISTSGSWLDTAYNLLVEQDNIELVVATIDNVKNFLYKKEGSTSFYIFPSRGSTLNYRIDSNENKKDWEYLKQKENPDLIQIWGTEFPHSMLTANVFKDKTIVVYMQGMVSQISKHYLSGLDEKELNSSLTIRDFIRRDTIKQQKKKFLRRAENENELLKLSNFVIVENNWCAINCKIINPDIQVIYSNLPINEEFFNHYWDKNKIEKNSIMTIAGGYPIKGLHVLLKALTIVKKEIPDFKLYIPGRPLFSRKNILDKIKKNGYDKILEDIILQNNLKENLVFMGNLSQKQMAHRMSISNIFVMPSSIENHSSSLIEAMIVGMPCIASNVGGVSELIQNNVNGFVYRFEEYEVLAYHMINLLKNDDKAYELAFNAQKIRNIRGNQKLGKELSEIYKKILRWDLPNT